MLARTPEPPYWAVVFTSIRTADDPEGYSAAADQMVRLAKEQPGYLGIESARGEDGVGITVSYWSSPEAIRAWKDHLDHAATREKGRARWYSAYNLRVCKVERAYDWTK